MGALGGGGGGYGGLWWLGDHFDCRPRKSRQQKDKYRASSEPSADAVTGRTGGYKFPLKQAVTAASLALTGDTIAQVREGLKTFKRDRHSLSDSADPDKDACSTIISSHDWWRSVRMTSYGFLFYGPGSYIWYQYLDRHLPQQTVQNLLLKVFLNQVILGPSVIAVVFAWNNLWQGKLAELPKKYQKDALSTLLVGFRFWIPVSALNFWLVPLQARVAFMSLGSIFWNFFLSSTMSK